MCSDARSVVSVFAWNIRICKMTLFLSSCSPGLKPSMEEMTKICNNIIIHPVVTRQTRNDHISTWFMVKYCFMLIILLVLKSSLGSNIYSKWMNYGITKQKYLLKENLLCFNVSIKAIAYECDGHYWFSVWVTEFALIAIELIGSTLVYICLTVKIIGVKQTVQLSYCLFIWIWLSLDSGWQEQSYKLCISNGNMQDRAGQVPTVERDFCHIFHIDWEVGGCQVSFT